jgi:hypothetical protein
MRQQTLSTKNLASDTALASAKTEDTYTQELLLKCNYPTKSMGQIPHSKTNGS